MRWQIEIWRCPHCQSQNLVARLMALGVGPFVYCQECRSAWPLATPKTVFVGIGTAARAPRQEAPPVAGVRVDEVTDELRTLQESGDLMVVRDGAGRLEVVW